MMIFPFYSGDFIVEHIFCHLCCSCVDVHLTHLINITYQILSSVKDYVFWVFPQSCKQTSCVCQIASSLNSRTFLKKCQNGSAMHCHFLTQKCRCDKRFNALAVPLWCYFTAPCQKQTLVSLFVGIVELMQFDRCTPSTSPVCRCGRISSRVVARKLCKLIFFVI